MPFLIFVLVIFHLIFLHTSGSNNPIGLNSSRDLISFHRYYTIKNLIGFILALSIFLAVIILVPNVLTDPAVFVLIRFDYYNIGLRPRRLQRDRRQLVAHLELDQLMSSEGPSTAGGTSGTRSADVFRGTVDS